MVYGGLHEVLDGILDTDIGGDDEDVEIGILSDGSAFEGSRVKGVGMRPARTSPRTPDSAKERAVALPMPWPTPVTKATPDV